MPKAPKFTKPEVPDNPYRGSDGWYVGYVYLVKFDGFPYYKIGCTVNPAVRMLTLQNQHNSPYTDLHLIPCDHVRDAERHMHYRYSGFQIEKSKDGYELFDLPQCKIDEIKSIKGIADGKIVASKANAR